MMSNIKYRDNDLIGPNNILMIKRTNKKNNNWYGLFKCPICGKNFETCIYYIKNGKTTRCKECTKKRRSELGKSKKKDLYGFKNGYLEWIEPTDKRSCGRIIWKVFCHKCNKYVYISSNNAFRNKACNQCSHEKNITGKRSGKLTAIKKINKKKNGFNVWLCKCDCGNTTEISIGDWGSTQSCGKCKCSHGENLILKCLEKMNINYIYQYIDDKCRNPKTNLPLRFDFYLPDYNTCIEYDGEGHYKAVNYWGGEEHLKDTQYRDNIKNEYCKNNNIKLIRIPYWNKEKINVNFLSEFITKE